MKDSEFEHQPLGNVVKGLASDEGMTLDQIKADLVSKGYDPDAFVSRMEARVKALSKESRLSWMKDGASVQSEVDAAIKGVKSWAKRSVAEIDGAFNDVLSGRYGPGAQADLQMAFSHLTELTPQGKAALLDGLDVLRVINETSRIPPQQ